MVPLSVSLGTCDGKRNFGGSNGSVADEGWGRGMDERPVEAGESTAPPRKRPCHPARIRPEYSLDRRHIATILGDSG